MKQATTVWMGSVGAVAAVLALSGCSSEVSDDAAQPLSDTEAEATDTEAEVNVETTPCDEAVDISETGVWNGVWDPGASDLARPGCGFAWEAPTGVGATVVAKWRAPYTGTFWVGAGDSDFHAIVGGARTCGVPDGCTTLTPGEGEGGGFNFPMEEGEVFYITVQHLDPNGAPAPAAGNVMVTVTPWTWGGQF